MGDVCKCNELKDARGVVCGDLQGQKCSVPLLLGCKGPEFTEHYAVVDPKTPAPPPKAEGEEQGGDEAEKPKLIRVGHGEEIRVSCAEGFKPIAYSEPPDTWGTDQYKGPDHVMTPCSNGTFLGLGWVQAVPQYKANHTEFVCVRQSWINAVADLTKQCAWAGGHLADTLSHNFEWKDTVGKQRRAEVERGLGLCTKFTSLHAHAFSEEEARYIAKLLGNMAVLRHGVPLDQLACEDLANHQTYKLAPDESAIAPKGWPVTVNVGSKLVKTESFSCSLTKDEQTFDWDVYNAEWVTWYRPGCLCQSKVPGGCPFQRYPDYAKFGFESVQTATVVGDYNLCYYWMHPTYPERGYLGYQTDLGKHLLAPVRNSTMVSREMNKARIAAAKERAKQQEVSWGTFKR